MTLDEHDAIVASQCMRLITVIDTYLSHNVDADVDEQFLWCTDGYLQALLSVYDATCTQFRNNKVARDTFAARYSLLNAECSAVSRA